MPEEYVLGEYMHWTECEGGEEFLLKKIRGATTFLLQNLKIQDFIFQKRAIFEDQKVIYVGSSDSIVFIGV